MYHVAMKYEGNENILPGNHPIASRVRVRELLSKAANYICALTIAVPFNKMVLSPHRTIDLQPGSGAKLCTLRGSRWQANTRKNSQFLQRRLFVRNARSIPVRIPRRY